MNSKRLTADRQRRTSEINFGFIMSDAVALNELNAQYAYDNKRFACRIFTIWFGKNYQENAFVRVLMENREKFAFSSLTCLFYNEDLEKSFLYTINQNGEVKAKEFEWDCDYKSNVFMNLLRKSDVILGCDPYFKNTHILIQKSILLGKKFIILESRLGTQRKGIIEHFVNGEIWLGATLRDQTTISQVDSKYDNGRNWIDPFGNKMVSNGHQRFITNFKYDYRAREPKLLTRSVKVKPMVKAENCNTMSLVMNVADIPYDYQYPFSVTGNVLVWEDSDANIKFRYIDSKGNIHEIVFTIIGMDKTTQKSVRSHYFRYNGEDRFTMLTIYKKSDTIVKAA